MLVILVSIATNRNSSTHWRLGSPRHTPLNFPLLRKSPQRPRAVSFTTFATFIPKCLVKSKLLRTTGHPSTVTATSWTCTTPLNTRTLTQPVVPQPSPTTLKEDPRIVVLNSSLGITQHNTNNV